MDAVVVWCSIRKIQQKMRKLAWIVIQCWFLSYWINLSTIFKATTRIKGNCLTKKALKKKSRTCYLTFKSIQKKLYRLAWHKQKLAIWIDFPEKPTQSANKIMLSLHRFSSPEIQIYSVLQAIKTDTERRVLIWMPPTKSPGFLRITKHPVLSLETMVGGFCSNGNLKTPRPFNWL